MNEIVPAVVQVDTNPTNWTNDRLQTALESVRQKWGGVRGRTAALEGEVFRLPDNFLVIATQNPREFEGTYPLPESQLDRFMLRNDIGHPERDVESEILRRYGDRLDGAAVPAIELMPLPAGLVEAARAEATALHVSDALQCYVLDLARATRSDARVSLGLSTRGTLALLRAARVAAGLRGSDYVSPDDVKDVAPWVIPHRLMLAAEAALEGVSDREVVDALLAATPVPA